MLPPEVATEIDGLRRAVGDPALGRIAPHITLVPPVNVREDSIGAALDVLRDAAVRVAPFTLTIGPAASFMPMNPVAYLDVRGDGLDRLHALRDAVFRHPLERPMTWPFQPHVTLGDGVPTDVISAALTAMAKYERTVEVDAVHLLEEVRDHAGTRGWVTLADVPLERPAVKGRGGIETEITASDATDPLVAAWLADRWPDPQRPLTVVARRRGDVVGVARGWTDGDLAHLRQLFVDPDVRREGVAGHLLDEFVDAARRRGATLCRLRTDAGSDAEAMYRRRGWTEEAVVPGTAADHRIVQLLRHL